MVIGIVAGVAISETYLTPTPVNVASIERMKYPLPDKPSIAVLPFVNMSEDPKQEFFSDGLTEEVITALSKSPHLFVIARNSAFTYKGKPIRVDQVAEQLGVRYVLEGSVRREANRVRITAQFIDALTGRHLWAERYDREMKEILTLQDEIALKIMTALHVKLQRDDAQVMARGVKNLDAYLKAMEGWQLVHRGTKEDNAFARNLGQEAITLDPNYARGFYLLATTHARDVWLGTTKFPKESWERAIEITQKAIAPGPFRRHSLFVPGLSLRHDPAVEQRLPRSGKGLDSETEFSRGFVQFGHFSFFREQAGGSNPTVQGINSVSTRSPRPRISGP